VLFIQLFVPIIVLSTFSISHGNVVEIISCFCCY